MAWFRRHYGAHPAQLLLLVAGFALAVYTVGVLGVDALWNPQVWWQSIAVWFAAAVVIHDLLLFPAYALADRVLHASTRRPRLPVAVINYVRVPVLASGLTLILFLPGIIEQGAPAYLAATGQTQQPFLGRWLLFTAAVFAASAAAYLLRVGWSQRRTSRAAGSSAGVADACGDGGAAAPGVGPAGR